MVHPHSIGICYEGGLNVKGQFADTRTVAQKRSMAKLIRELLACFPKARIFGHGDQPGVHRACPCYDVGANQNGEKPSQSLKNQPQIRGRPMPGVQKPASDSGDIYARGAETCLRFKGHLCPGCRDMPQIQGTFMPGVQKHDPDSRDIYAWDAETRLRFKGHLCPGGRNQNQIQGIFMHGVQRHEPDLRLISHTISLLFYFGCSASKRLMAPRVTEGRFFCDTTFKYIQSGGCNN